MKSWTRKLFHFDLLRDVGGDKRVGFFQTERLVAKSQVIRQNYIKVFLLTMAKKVTTNGAQIKVTLVNTPDIFCIEHGGHEEQ